MRRLSLIAVFLFVNAAFAAPPEAVWPKTAFINGIQVPTLKTSALASPLAAVVGCGNSTCSSPPDGICGQCSIACATGRASVCYPGTHITESGGKEVCSQRPACSCN